MFFGGVHGAPVPQDHGLVTVFVQVSDIISQEETETGAATDDIGHTLTVTEEVTVTVTSPAATAPTRRAAAAVKKCMLYLMCLD